MTMFYSKSKNGFFSLDVHGSNMPIDCMEISQEKYSALLSGETADVKISADDFGLPILAERPPLDDATLAASARAKRNKLISSVDYMFRSDYPIAPDKLAELAKYSQALRDIPSQPGFPSNINWPEKP